MFTQLQTGIKVKKQYKIIKKLGQGSFGRTYLAQDENALNQLCVLKEFVPSSKKPEIVEKYHNLFEQEAKVLSQIDHPQITKFKAYFTEQGRLFIVQEYVDGKTYWQLLQERRQQNQLFSENEINQWLRNLLDVLNYIHTPTPSKETIIHRDISPDNIMWCNKRQKPVLIDFSAVKLAIANASFASNSPPGTTVGKVGYAPPEQLTYGRCDVTSDLYSLAVTAIVLLTGKQPELLIDQHGNLIWQNFVTVSDNFARILNKMWEQIPEKRYQSANEVLADLNKTQVSISSSQPKSVLPGTVPSITPTEISQLTALPTTITTPTTRTQTALMPWKQIAIGSLAMILGGSFALIVSPHVELICQIFDNCNTDPQQERESQNIYDRAVAQAEESRREFEDSQTIGEMKNVRNIFDNAIRELRTIPSNTKVYQPTQQRLRDYDNDLKQMDTRLKTETNAEKQLAEAEKISNEARYLFIVGVMCPEYEIQDLELNAAESQRICDCLSDAFISREKYELESVKAEWEKAGEMLKSIPSDSLIAEKVKELSAESDRRIKNIQDWINCQVW
ncbi:MAG: serine/threonine-protein kinase [Oscillatoria sp. PMC 1051.18]|nr:serine/threonine-protein kinase [Oscillatoria sp. PMC 1051.18]